jgi:hypothetical protein
MATQIAEPGGTNWRVALDRAWRSPAMRRTFESECGMAPLAETDAGMHQQASSGHAERYHHEFQVWATRRLGLEMLAPPAIKQLLSQGR